MAAPDGSRTPVSEESINKSFNPITPTALYGMFHTKERAVPFLKLRVESVIKLFTISPYNP